MALKPRYSQKRPPPRVWLWISNKINVTCYEIKDHFGVSIKININGQLAFYRCSIVSVYIYLHRHRYKEKSPKLIIKWSLFY